MSDTLAFLIILFSPTIGIMLVIVGKPAIKEKTNKKLPLYLCDIVCAFGIVLFISYIICSKGEHINAKYTYTEYPIEKLTFSNVYFNDRGGDNLNESYVIIEKPNEKYQNVVIVEREEYIMQWFCKVKTSTTRFHVYLTEEVYYRLKNGYTIYEVK